MDCRDKPGNDEGMSHNHGHRHVGKITDDFLF